MPENLFTFHSNTFYKNVEETDTLINGSVRWNNTHAQTLSEVQVRNNIPLIHLTYSFYMYSLLFS